MKQALSDTAFTQLFEKELSQICAFYQLDEKKVLQTLQPLSPFFEAYWEMVFSANEFEIITAGNGTAFTERILDLAGHAGLSVKTQLLYEACQNEFPLAIKGIKLCFSGEGTTAPTLYLRTKMDVEQSLGLLKKHLGSSELTQMRTALENNSVLYGLGFSEKQGSPYLKTYTIGEVETANSGRTKGFVSYRFADGELLKEHKTYLPDVSLKAFRPANPVLEKLRNFLEGTMHYDAAGHIGVLHKGKGDSEHKIYIERVGGIPTDFSAR